MRIKWYFVELFGAVGDSAQKHLFIVIFREFETSPLPTTATEQLISNPV